MDPKRWTEVNRIFHAALAVEPFGRRGFVSSAAEGDSELEHEVIRLLDADSEASDFLESPVAFDYLSEGSSRPLVGQGDILKDRFRIESHLGEGGMGHVYKAWDLDLHVWTALKVLRLEIAANPDAIEYFRREVRTARSITHRNVCRTYDLHRAEFRSRNGVPVEIYFLTMEFLDGETLSDRITRKGALNTNEALALAGQIAAGLDSAHAAVVIHRDLKPGNVMLVVDDADSSGTRAVVMDFGLARQSARAGASALSHGSMVGTIAYMAPEQLAGGAATPATDIYAFGLVLFEMVTGSRAFPSDNLLSGVAQRLSGPAPDPRHHVRNLNDNWCAAIQECLQPVPEQRPATAAAAMALAAGSLSAQRPRSTSLRRPTRLVTTVSAALVVLFVVLALFTLGLRLIQTRATTAVSPGALVYLAPLRNETGDATYDHVSELLETQLEQSSQVVLLDRARVGDVLQRMNKSVEIPIDAPLAREIALRTGSVRVIFPRIFRAGRGYNLEVEVQQPDNTPARARQRWKRSFPWDGETPGLGGPIPDALLNATRTASDWVRKQVGESANDIARLNAPPQDVSTANWHALQAYAEAQALLEKHNKLAAMDRYRDAVRLDPNFARAYAGLADNLISIDRLQEGYQAYLDALRTDMGQRLTLKERDFIRGAFATDTHDYATAVAAFRDLTSFYEADFRGWFNQCYPLEMLDRPQEAFTAVQRADSLSGPRHSAANLYVLNYLLRGDLDNARKWIEVLATHPTITPLAMFEGNLALLEGKPDEADRDYVQVQTAADATFRALGHETHIRLLAEQGDFLDALKAVDNEETSLGSELQPGERAGLWLDRAYVDWKLGNASRALDDFERSMHLDSSPDYAIAASTVLGNIVSTATPALRARAIAALKQLQATIPARSTIVINMLARAITTGELLLAQGHADAALREFRRADALDAPLTQREYLARALLAASRSSSSTDAPRLRAEALAAYGKVARRPQIVWREAWNYPPGFIADQMLNYSRLARELKAGPIPDSTATWLRAMRRTSVPQQTSSAQRSPVSPNPKAKGISHA